MLGARTILILLQETFCQLLAVVITDGLTWLKCGVYLSLFSQACNLILYLPLTLLHHNAPENYA